MLRRVDAAETVGLLAQCFGKGEERIVVAYKEGTVPEELAEKEVRETAMPPWCRVMPPCRVHLVATNSSGRVCYAWVRRWHRCLSPRTTLPS